MTHPDLHNELARVDKEPLLPIEKKLIAWSFGLGIVLLAALALFNHFFPLA
jgi:hypothetical protein